jgi:XTP/dITP diphosphohydrolase
MAGMKISQKAAAQGFEWDNIEGVWDKFQEELSEFRHAISYEGKARQQAELGDLLFTVINIARWYDLDPTEALHSTNQRFIARIEYMESFASKPLSEHTLAELESLWQAAKQKLSE